MPPPRSRNTFTFTGAQASVPPSVNPGARRASWSRPPTETGAGAAVQVIEWDADGNSAFERLEYTVPTNTGGNIVHPALTAPNSRNR